jgi:hypothetical protein
MLIPIDGLPREVDLPNGDGPRFLTSVRALIGTDCAERVWITDRWEAWLDEDGGSAGKPVNQAATRLAQSFGWQLSLLGPVVIVGLGKNSDRPAGLSQDQTGAILLRIASGPVTLLASGAPRPRHSRQPRPWRDFVRVIRPRFPPIEPLAAAAPCSPAGHAPALATWAIRPECRRLPGPAKQLVLRQGQPRCHRPPLLAEAGQRYGVRGGTGRPRPLARYARQRISLDLPTPVPERQTLRCVRRGQPLL